MDDHTRALPLNELDYNLQLTDPKWGQEIGKEFMFRLNEKGKSDRIKEFLTNLLNNSQIEEEQANYIYENIILILRDNKDSLWSVLSFFTRDLRLANLSVWDGEVAFCEKHLNFAGDCLQYDLKRSFSTVIKPVASKLEISQSKNGFLRKRMGTLTTENISNEFEPKKKNFFGMSKRE